MHNEVDGEFFRLLIHPTDRIGTQDRPGVLRHDVAHLVEIQRFGIDRVRVEENEFDVAIGGGTSRLRGQVVVSREESGKALAAEHDALHVRRHSLGPDNGEFDWLTLAHAV